MGAWLSGRAPPSHGGGQWFESTSAHHSKPENTGSYADGPNGGPSGIGRGGPLGDQTGAILAGLPRRRSPFVRAALICSFWAIPGSLGGIVALVETVLAFILLTMVAAIRKDARPEAEYSAVS